MFRLVPGFAVLVASSLLMLPAAGQDPATITLSGPDQSVPHKVLENPQDYEVVSFSFSVRADPAAEVTLTTSGDGVRAEPVTQVVDTAEKPYARIEVTADPGLHRLTVTATADGAEPVTLEYLVWSPGGEPIAGTGDLTGRHLLWRGWYTLDDRGFIYSTALLFLDDRWVYRGIPVQGVPSCRGAARPAGCELYHYDVGTGLVQVGDVAIGRMTVDGIYMDGFGPRSVSNGEGWGQRTFEQALGTFRPGARLAGVWRWRDEDAFPDPNLARMDLRLGHEGRAVWRRYDDEGTAIIRSGHYRLGGRGTVRLHGGWGSRVLTFLPCLDARGRPSPDRCVAVSFGGRGWRHSLVLDADGRLPDPRTSAGRS